jgi:hypothetical protein
VKNVLRLLRFGVALYLPLLGMTPGGGRSCPPAGRSYTITYSITYRMDDWSIEYPHLCWCEVGSLEAPKVKVGALKGGDEK